MKGNRSRMVSSFARDSRTRVFLFLFLFFLHARLLKLAHTFLKRFLLRHISRDVVPSLVHD